jgi:hypothetical protein
MNGWRIFNKIDSLELMNVWRILNKIDSLELMNGIPRVLRPHLKMGQVTRFNDKAR